MKKVIFTTILALLIITFSGCNSAKVDELNDRTIQLQKDKEKLEQELDLEKNKNQEFSNEIKKLESEIQQGKNKFDVLIEEIELKTEEVYKEGPAKGKFYGKFDVLVKVVNNSQKNLENVKVSVKMETSLNSYEKSLDVKTEKLSVIKKLNPQEESEMIFTDFNVDHPEVVQELIVNIIDYGEIEKIKIPSAFPPGSLD